MPDVNLQPPFEAYAGEEPFVFVSYAHNDGHLVYPEIKALHDSGVRIWFDGGIDPGNEWPEDIAQALLKTQMFLVFITPSSVKSKNVCNEINFAINKNKSFLAVHLQETQLPAGLELRMGDIQAILKYRMTEENYNKKLLDSFSKVVVGEEKKPKIEMVLIPAGKFIMGSPESEENREDNERQHEVTLTKPFYMGKYEVTQEQWESLGMRNRSDIEGAKLPVTDVSWEDCQEFIKKLNEKTDGGYRLPTEAEWEYACRARTTTAYSFGDVITPKDANYDDSKIGKPVAVGSYKPNAFGIYDMHGNVWEWCEDWYGDYPDGAVMDPRCPATGEYRVLRGGSFLNDVSKARSSNRFNLTSTIRSRYRGIRLARTPVVGDDVLQAVLQSKSPIIVQQRRTKVNHIQLLAILRAHVGPGRVTTYRQCSLWAFGHVNGGSAVRSMLEANAQQGHFELTNRVVAIDGSCGAADQNYGQSAQLRAEGVPFIGQMVDLINCPPVVLPQV